MWQICKALRFPWGFRFFESGVKNSVVQTHEQRPQCRAYTLLRPSDPTNIVLKASRRISLGCPALSRIVQAVSQTGL